MERFAKPWALQPRGFESRRFRLLYEETRNVTTAAKKTIIVEVPAFIGSEEVAVTLTSTDLKTATLDLSQFNGATGTLSFSMENLSEALTTLSGNDGVSDLFKKLLSVVAKGADSDNMFASNQSPFGSDPFGIGRRGF